MKRRDFLSTTALLSSGFPAVQSTTHNSKSDSKLYDVLCEIPNYASHEHWGSLFSIGTAPGGFRADFEAGALPGRRTTLADVIIDPYMGGNLNNADIDPWKIKDGSRLTDIYSLFAESKQRGIKVLHELLADQILTGTYLALRRGILALYDVDIQNIQSVDKVHRDIAMNYEHLYDFYTRVSETYFSGLIRPVHPEYYASMKKSSALPENKMTRTVLRIDPFMDLCKNDARRKTLAEIAGVEPMDAASWRHFLQNIFLLALDNNAVGIKQLQAYSRDLDFQFQEDGQVNFTADLSAEEERLLQNWIMHECCKLANDLSWPHQVHVGTHNLPFSNPLPLQHLATRYPRQNLVLLHCWPFLQESGYLAKQVPNIYLDTCWQSILNPEFLRHALDLWLNYVPLSKIMMGNDATSIEMAVGASLLTKEILAASLESHTDDFAESQILKIAKRLVHDNAERMYGKHPLG